MRPNRNCFPDSLIECFDGYRIAIEFLNRSWTESDQLGVTAAFCKKRRVAFVDVDAPEDSHFTVMPRLDLVTNRDLGYLRCHGRNADWRVQLGRWACFR